MVEVSKRFEIQAALLSKLQDIILLCVYDITTNLPCLFEVQSHRF